MQGCSEEGQMQSALKKLGPCVLRMLDYACPFAAGLHMTAELCTSMHDMKAQFASELFLRSAAVWRNAESSAALYVMLKCKQNRSNVIRLPVNHCLGDRLLVS